MNFEEFKTLAKGMKSVWTQENFLQDKYSMNVWFGLLHEIPYETANAAVQIHMRTSKWPPTPADIIGVVAKGQTQIGDWSEGWEQVIKAIGRYGYTNEAEALKSMDETTQRAVKRLGWKQICQSDQDELMSIRANFRQIYGQIKDHAEEQARIPVELSKAISGAVKQIGGTA